MSEKNTAEKQGWDVHVMGRHVQVTEPMKQYAHDKVLKMDRFANNILRASVTMDIQKLEHRVDITVKLGHTKIRVSASSPDMYASIDMAVAKLHHKLTRYHQRLAEHHARPMSMIEMNVNVIDTRKLNPLDEINDEIEEENLKRMEAALKPHPVVKKKSLKLKTLRLNEAVMKMELSDDHFLIYRSEEDMKLKAIYRRRDETYGIIEIE
ncbi:MAG: ribosome-associated translation inhibitor RaiA [Verrucomicrobia bacterium]|nr:ribosome-associated translation inhibitor RaiA [Verrucomicrobiota bacterium]